MPPLRVILCGARNWTDQLVVEKQLATLEKGSVVINGGAPGLDTIAARVARKLGLEVITVPADWRRLGRAAGPIRNKKMLDLKPDEVWAFHNDITKSKGTKDMLAQAANAKVPSTLFANVGILRWPT